MNKSVRFAAFVPLALAAAFAAALGPAALAAPAPRFPQDPAAAAAPPDARLATILEKAAEYCRRLEGAALDFTCLEKIVEKTFRPPLIKPDMAVNMSGTAGGRMSYAYQSADTGFENQLIYDYQLVRKGGKATERRILVDDNGIKKHEEDAVLATFNVRVENALFGPVGLLGEKRQPHYDYRVVGEERKKGVALIVVEAVPKPTLEGPHCHGRIWVKEDDASIVRIAWNQKSVGNFAQVEAMARDLGAEPDLTSTTEYDVVKNGLRFPGKDTTEEAYVLKKGKRFVRSKTTIAYTDYKFFTVETEVGN